MRPPHSAEAWRGVPERILFPPMLFARNALAPEPQAYFFADKAIEKAREGNFNRLTAAHLSWFPSRLTGNGIAFAENDSCPLPESGCIFFFSSILVGEEKL